MYALGRDVARLVWDFRGLRYAWPGRLTIYLCKESARILQYTSGDVASLYLDCKLAK